MIQYNNNWLFEDVTSTFVTSTNWIYTHENYEPLRSSQWIVTFVDPCSSNQKPKEIKPKEIKIPIFFDSSETLIQTFKSIYTYGNLS